ncbi:hypothetical protein HPB48_002377 [Haemaphysalis longicornis]|uniref:Uncharacterized protein n=1 Tax=Haemaphysalis longicornis TaxID=44386 RepID=A0A9J6GFK8_HAELO|nr:hypothetical protein HPB48_002377 [Haemaphysalis longicornis]
MKRVYYKEVVGAFIVFDVRQSQTFEAVRKSDLDSKMQQPERTSIPCVLLGNKVMHTRAHVSSQGRVNGQKLSEGCVAMGNSLCWCILALSNVRNWISRTERLVCCDW